jgi:preprotein translocase subunit SecD
MVRFKFKAAASAALAAAAISGNAVAASCPRIEIAAVAPQGDAGARVFRRIDGGSVAVSSAPLVSSKDVIEANVSFAEGQTGLNVRVSADAAERVRGYSARHVGDQLAFIVDGRARMVLKILDPIARDGFWISPMDPAAANHVASALHDCARDPSR